MSLSPSVARYFDDYLEYHRSAGNKICHYIGIPMITVTLLGLLGRLTIGSPIFPESSIFRIDGGSVFWLIAVVWYLRLDWRLGLSFAPIGLAAYFVGRAMPVPALWGFFILGWILQFIGHGVYEKKSPAFLRNVRHILIGPLWVYAQLTRWT